MGVQEPRLAVAIQSVVETARRVTMEYGELQVAPPPAVPMISPMAICTDPLTSRVNVCAAAQMKVYCRPDAGVGSVSVTDPTAPALVKVLFVSEARTV